MDTAVAVRQRHEALQEGLSSIRDQILMDAGPEYSGWTDQKREVFLERLVAVISRDQALAPCFESTAGKRSIIEAARRAVATGLMVDGRHAYLVPQRRKEGAHYVTEARFSLKAVGYRALLCGGARPIFRALRSGVVYEQDSCRVDSGTGEVSHEVAIASDRGGFLGVWVQCEELSSRKEARYYHAKKIQQWRAASQSRGGSPWETWLEEMAEQAAIRHFARRYEEARDLLSEALYEEGTGEAREQPASTTEEAEAAIDRALSTQEESQTPPAQAQQEEPGATEDPEPPPEGEEIDLF